MQTFAIVIWVGRVGYDPWVIAVVCAVYDKCNYSIHCHIPLEAIASRFRTDLRGFVKKAVKRAVTLGLLYRKGGTKSYGLTKEGFQVVKEFCIES